MKHPYDIARPGLEPRCYRSVANHATGWSMELPVIYIKYVLVQQSAAQVTVQLVPSDEQKIAQIFRCPIVDRYQNLVIKS